MGSPCLDSPFSSRASWRQQGILCPSGERSRCLPLPWLETLTFQGIGSPSGSSFHASGIFMQWVKIPGAFGDFQAPRWRWEMLGNREG